MSFEQIDILVSGLVYLGAVLVLFLLGKVLYDKLHPSFVLREELFERDNFALSLAMVGYYLGLVLALGGVLAGESSGLGSDLFDIFYFGLLALVLLNASGWINDKIIFNRFDMTKELIHDRNAGSGAIEAGSRIASGLIIAGALSAEEVDLVTAIAFWGLGQLALALAIRIYDWMTSFDLHAEIEGDNVAVGVATAGLLIAVGNIVRLSLSGELGTWQDDLSSFAVYVTIGLVMLPVMRIVTDKLMLPGVKLNDELVGQEHPNVGAGAIEAFSYVAASMLIGWAIF
jgi:uncharacterized membrane protein YjfL (UPF0719 family)